MRLRGNFGSGTLSASMLIGDTSMSSAGLALLPVVAAPDYLVLTLDPQAVYGTPEIVRVTAHASLSTSATIVRSQEGTSARAHGGGEAWAWAPTAQDWAYVDTDVFVDEYLAKGDGVTDDTVAISNAISQAPAGSRLRFRPGATYIVSPTLQPNTSYGCLNPSVPLTFHGPGTTLKIKNGSVPITASTFLIYVSGSPAWTVIDDGLTLDCNGQNQALAGMPFSYNLCGIASRNASQAGLLRLGSINILNASATAGGSSNFTGIGVDDYGFAAVMIDGTVRVDNYDAGYWHTTQVPNSGLCRVVGGAILGHNPRSGSGRTLYIEQAGQITLDAVFTYCDAPTSGAYGVVLFTGANGDVKDVHLGRVISEGCGSVSLGAGGANYLDLSSFGVLSATGSPSTGAVAISQVRPGVIFKAIEADSTNAGSIVTVVGNDATHYPVIDRVAIGNPSAGASLDGGSGPVVINGGWVGGAINNVSATGQIRNVKGYNPVGVVTPAVPLSTVPVAAVPYDRTFYITTAAGVSTFAIQGGPTVTIPASGFGTIRVPAGQTMTPTYANAPTWVVEGE